MSTWLTGTLGCQGLGTVCQLWCSGLGTGKMRRGGDDVEEEEEEEITMVGGGDSKKRSTPSKKKLSSDDSGDEVDGPPKRPAKKAKDNTPLNMFHAKVGQAKGKKAPPKKK